MRRHGGMLLAHRLLVLFGFALGLQAQGLTDTEFRFLKGYLERSRLMLHDAVRGVSDRQWRFKPKPFRWSVAECSEHIILTERWLMSEFETKFGKGNEPAYIFHWRPKPKPGDFKALPIAERRIYDLRILTDMLDRSTVDTSVPRGVPPEVSIVPKDRFSSPGEMLAEFDAVRERTVRIVEGSRGRAREAYVYPGSADFLLDGYQYLLRIPSHSERHIMQLQEVKRDPNYP